RALPARRRLRVLVLDAGGCPGLPRFLAQLDPQRCDCLVLCRTPQLADEARALVAGHSAVAVRSADLEQPHLERSGELLEPFDLVIAEQGAGWAREPARVLAHLRELTAAHGVLALGAARVSRASGLARDVLRA